MILWQFIGSNHYYMVLMVDGWTGVHCGFIGLKWARLAVPTPYYIQKQ